MNCEHCVEGLIKKGEFPHITYEICDCLYWNESKKAYLLSGGEERYSKRKPSELENGELLSSKNQPLPLFEVMRNLSIHMKDMIEHNTFIFLIGENGTGKTQLAHSLAWMHLYMEARKENPPKAKNHLEKVLFLKAHAIKNFIFDFEKKKAFYEKLENTDILVIDDMGAEMQTVDNATTRILDEWNTILREFKGCVIITSNAFLFLEPLKEPKQESDIYANGRKMYNDKRLKSILGKTNRKLYVFDGDNMRKKQKPSFLNGFE